MKGFGFALNLCVSEINSAKPYLDLLHVRLSRGLKIERLSFAFIGQTANARQRKTLRYQAIKSRWTFKTVMHNYSFDTRRKI